MITIVPSRLLVALGRFDTPFVLAVITTCKARNIDLGDERRVVEVGKEIQHVEQLELEES